MTILVFHIATKKPILLERTNLQSSRLKENNIRNIMSRKLCDVPDLEPDTILQEGRDYFTIDEFSAEDLKDFPTSRGLVVTYLDRIETDYQQWQKFLPRVKVYYAVKAFNNPEVLRKLHSLGAKFEVASVNETKDCLRIGAKTDDILASHPQKSVQQLRAYEKLGIRLLTVDSIEELKKTLEYHPESELLIRVAAAEPETEAKIALGRKFGSSIPYTKDLLSNALEMGFNVRGISFHVGLHPTDLNNHGQTIMSLRQLFDFSLAKFGHKMDILDIGGGFLGAHKVKEFEKMASTINCALQQCFPEDEGVEILAEPGTYFADGCTDIYSCVIGKKKFDLAENRVESGENGDLVEGLDYYLNDGVYGSLYMCQLFPDLSTWWSLENEKIEERSKNHGNLYLSKLWGPTLTSLDSLSDKVAIPELDTGTWIWRNNCGAYSLDLQTRFNGMPLPLHVVVKKNE